MCKNKNLSVGAYLKCDFSMVLELYQGAKACTHLLNIFSIEFWSCMSLSNIANMNLQEFVIANGLLAIKEHDGGYIYDCFLQDILDWAIERIKRYTIIIF